MMNGRQYVPHGPRIPQEVLDALDEERLVFFCGAGISIGTFTRVRTPSGEKLLTFQGLTTFAFDACNAGIDPCGRPTDPAAADAFDRELYDKALEILEARENRSGIMRQRIMRRLTEPPLAESLALHQAILALAKLPAKPGAEERGYRLVTTNFDNRFELAGLHERWIEAAPRLSPPHHEVESPAVYLHGRVVPATDPYGRCLVLTSADFGNAYLRHRWATSYVLELFREFTVLFVGYGLNDPVMRYLMDALATESGHGRQFRRAYALAPYRIGDRQDRNLQEALWRAKNVEPILFACDHDRTRPYGLQTDTLIQWSERHGAGLEGRLQDAIEATKSPFIAGQDDREPFDSLSKVVWALSEQSGETARRFATFSEPPDASWFGPVIDRMIPVSELPGADDRSAVGGNSVTARWLARWACRHLETAELVGWAIDRRSRLFPALRQEIEYSLTNATSTPDEPYKRFWSAVLHAGPPEPGSASNMPITLATPEGRLGLGDRRNLLKAIRPRLEGPFAPLLGAGTTSARTTRAESVRELGYFELRLGWGYTADMALDCVKLLLESNSDIHDEMLVDLADDLTTLVLGAMEIATEAELPCATGRSIWDYPSIARKRNENASLHDWVQSVDLLLQAWEAARRTRPIIADMLSRRWLVLGETRGFSLFIRLYLHAVAETDTIDAAPAFEQLKATAVLWDDESESEVLRLLRRRGAELQDERLDQLVATIERGPPREFYSADDDELAERDIRRRLGKLMEGGAKLRGRARERAEEYLRNRLARGVSDDEDEKRHIHVEARWIAPPSAEALTNLPISEQVLTIMAHLGYLGIVDDWKTAQLLQDLLRRTHAGHLELLRQLWTQGERRAQVWHGAFWGLQALAEAKDAKLSQLLPDITAFCEDHRDLVTMALRSFCDWIEKLAESTLVVESAEDNLWRLWGLAADVGAEIGAPSGLCDDVGTPTGALNAPGGGLAETLLVRQGMRPTVEGGGLDATLRARFDRLADDDSDLGRYARIRFAASLAWLFWRDPNWVEKKIIRRMAWSAGGNAEAARLWRGFLHRPHLTAALLSLLKSHILDALRHEEELKDDYETLCKLFADIGVEVPENFSRNETADAIRAMGPQGAKQALIQLGRKLEAADNKAASLWRQRVAPWIEAHWPADAAFRSTQITTTVSKLLIATRDAFPDALRLLRAMQLIGPTNEPFHLLNVLAPTEREHGSGPERYDYVLNHPHDVCEWLDQVLPGTLIWNRELLSKIVERMKRIDPTLTERACFRRLQQRLH